MAKKQTDWDKQKSYYFCCVTHDLDLAEEMKKVCLDFNYYAFIRHEPDSEEGSPHYHFIVAYNGSRSVKQMADKLGIPSNFVQPCRKVVAYRRYLLHLDNDEKIKYKESDVVTNNKALLHSAVLGNDGRDINDIFGDWIRLRRGELTKGEFVQQNYIELQKLNLYQKMKTLELIEKISQTQAHKTT